MDYLLKASAVIALFYLCFHFFLKKETFFNNNRWFLLIGVVIALIFPFIVIPIHIAIEPILVSETAFAITESIPTTVSTPLPESQFDWLILLPITYGIGLVFFISQFLFQFGSLILLLFKNPKNKDGIYTYVIVNNKISPFSFFKWIVYNPESFNDTELNLMLTHEKVHANQLHSIDILLIQLACSIFWFNPLIWFYRKEVRQNLEYIADYSTQEQSNNEKDYQRLLLKTTVANHNISLSNNFYNSLIKERIVMLKKSRSNRKKQFRYLLVLPLLAGLLMSVNTEKVYTETESKISINENIIEFVVTKNTTDAELKTMSNIVEDKGGTLVFNEIKRNNDNELTSIFVKLYDHSYDGGSSDIPIDSFIIYKELFGNGGGYVGRTNGSTMHFDKKLSTISDKEIEKLQKRVHKAIIKNRVQTVNIDKQNSTNYQHIEIVFNKNMSDQDLENIKKELKSNDINMTIKHIKRNKKGEISDINIDFKTENGSANYNIKDENGIKSFYFKMNENGSFGVGAQKDNEFVIVETINSNEHIDSKGNVFIHKNQDEVIEIIKDSLHNHKVRILNNKANHLDSIYVIRDHRSNIIKDSIHMIIKDYKIDSSNAKTSYFYQSDRPVKIIKSQETISLNNRNSLNKNKFTYRSQNPQPIYVVDGKVIKNYKLSTVNPNNIESLNVLKGNSAKELYGKKGENGVLVITTKNPNSFTLKGTKDKSPWRVEVGGVRYIDDDDPRKNSTLAYLTKYTSDVTLDKHKENLKKMGIIVKFTKLKRNKSGEIISIKVSLTNEKGSKSSATWKVNDGIPSIEFGETEGSLIARTSDMN